MKAKGTYDGFMKSICTAAQFDQQYTAHFLRVAAIQTMNDAGFEKFNSPPVRLIDCSEAISPNI
ncbi:hypothetical protein MAR_021648 [Mya arenaria]|uniref:Uncharacterized protein n=1 Tax=Mya arenaria TaxID=6604 RepID=A0ABY7EAZ0_MYAAR|nr:hypothetical protein MAR_021648 [Mya arenaria]